MTFRRVYALLLIAVVTFLFLNFTSEQFSEELRRRIENKNFIFTSSSTEQIHCKKALPNFYVGILYEAIWNKKNIEQLCTFISSADKHGLNPTDYHLDLMLDLNAKFSELTPAQKVDLELMATDGFLLYFSHLSAGKIDPKTVDPEWSVSRSEANPIENLKSYIQDRDLEAIKAAVLPQHRAYKNLKKALVKYKNLKDKGGWKEVHEGETIKAGAIDPRINLVRQRMLATGDLKDDASKDPNLYDDELIAAVQRFQFRHGLEEDGAIGKSTIYAMNFSVEERINQIRSNLERWRWLPKEFSSYYIKVNIADFNLEIMRSDSVVKKFKVIVGKYYRKTPVFSSKMSYLVLNPTWTVPPGILNKDILPVVKKNPDYLKTKKLTVYNAQGEVVNPATIDWSSSVVKSYIYRQPAGPDNALGAVKFMFPNPYSIYIHDTPSRDLFHKSERSFSSGCVRLHNPLEMAEYVINDRENWSLERIKKQIESKQTITVPIKEQPDIHILYFTTWTGDESIIHFRRDIYERDKAVVDALNSKPPSI